jgi:hypothetical protein
MNLPTNYSPYASWTTEALKEEIMSLQCWSANVKVCRNAYQLSEKRRLERMENEMRRRINA